MTPYRDAPRLLLCPRCGEVLERVFDGALACLRCAGVWLAQPTIDLAFGSPTWPHGSSAWWKIELECPECAAEGNVTALVPYLAGDVMIDRCTGHGIWLDAGELGRLMNKPEHSELVELYRLLQPVGELPPSLAAHRNEDDAERARRRNEAEAERARIRDLRRSRKADSAAERRATAEAGARARLDALPPPRARPVPTREPEPPPTPAADRNAAKRAELRVHRAQAAARLSDLEQELTSLRERLLDTEQRVRTARVDLRAIDVSLDELA